MYNSKSLEYIRSGELIGAHKGATCRSRKRWYSVGEYQPANILWMETMGYVHRVFKNDLNILESDKFYGITVDDPGDKLLNFLNSSIMILFKLLSGFNSLGQGALKTSVREVKDFQIPSLDLLPVPDKEAFDNLLSREILPINEELENEDRKILDAQIFQGLGLPSEDLEELYEGIRKIYSNRISKAKSIT